MTIQQLQLHFLPSDSHGSIPTYQISSLGNKLCSFNFSSFCGLIYSMEDNTQCIHWWMHICEVYFIIIHFKLLNVSGDGVNKNWHLIGIVWIRELGTYGFYSYIFKWNHKVNLEGLNEVKSIALILIHRLIGKGDSRIY